MVHVGDFYGDTMEVMMCTPSRLSNFTDGIKRYSLHCARCEQPIRITEASYDLLCEKELFPVCRDCINVDGKIIPKFLSDGQRKEIGIIQNGC